MKKKDKKQQQLGSCSKKSNNQVFKEVFQIYRWNLSRIFNMKLYMMMIFDLYIYMKYKFKLINQIKNPTLNYIIHSNDLWIIVVNFYFYSSFFSPFQVEIYLFPLLPITTIISHKDQIKFEYIILKFNFLFYLIMIIEILLY